MASLQQPHRGREGVFIGDGFDRSCAQTVPRQVRFLPPGAIGVAFGTSPFSRVKGGCHRANATDADLSREKSVETLEKPLGWDCRRQVAVRYLPRCMDARVGSSSTNDRHDAATYHRTDRTFHLALHGPAVVLTLPAVKRASEVGDDELYSSVHTGYPRTGEVAAKGGRSVIVASVLALQVVLAPGMLSSDEVQYFPGSYFDKVARSRLQKKAMERWPGPATLRQLWLEGNLDENQRITLLLGGAAFHDPWMLRLYRQAVQSDSPRLRQAAAYGYRDLIADQLPNVAGGVDDQSAEYLAIEMRGVRRTLYYRSMVEMWLQGVLTSEGKSLPGYRGFVPDRSPKVCFQAVDRLMGPEDLETMVRSYRISTDKGNRITLLKLIEALTLNQFIVRPLGDRKAWGPEIYERGLASLDAWIDEWLDQRCTLSYRRVVSRSLAKMGAEGVRPLSPDACYVWGLVLKQGDSRWWAVAARRLYECGGPWVELSVLHADSAESRQRRDRLVRWHRLRDHSN